MLAGRHGIQQKVDMQKRHIVTMTLKKAQVKDRSALCIVQVIRYVEVTLVAHTKMTDPMSHNDLVRPHIIRALPTNDDTDFASFAVCTTKDDQLPAPLLHRAPFSVSDHRDRSHKPPPASFL